MHGNLIADSLTLSLPPSPAPFTTRSAGAGVELSATFGVDARVFCIITFCAAGGDPGPSGGGDATPAAANDPAGTGDNPFGAEAIASLCFGRRLVVR